MTLVNKKNECKLLKDDLPKKSFLIFDKKNKIIFSNEVCYKFIFGCKLINETNQFYINQHSKSGVMLLEKIKKDSIVSERLFSYNDTLNKKMSNKFFKNYSYFLSNTLTNSKDTIFIYDFIKNPVVVNKSHECFLPLKQVYISKRFGIKKVVLEDFCFNLTYE